MVNRLVSVDESNNLPSEVQAQLVGNVETYFETLTDQAETAASTATTAASTSGTNAANAEIARIAAEAAAASASAPTDEMVASLIADTGSDTGSLLASTYQRGNVAVDIRLYGATSGGDSTSAIQAAVDAAAGRPVVVPSGTWTCAGSIYLPSNTTLVLQAGAVLLGTLAPGMFLRAEGTEAPGVATTATVAVGARTITAPGHGLVEGDLFRLGSNQVYDASSTSSTIGELLYVDSVSGSAITTLTPVVGGPYTTAGGTTVSKITPVKNVTIVGPGTVRGTKVAESNQMGLFVRFGTNINIEDVNFEFWDQRHSAFRDTRNLRVRNCNFDWAIHTSQAYGVSLIDATQDVLIENCTFTNVRHSLSTNNSTGGKGIPRRVRFAFNTINWSSVALGGSMGGGDAIDTHTAAEEIWIENNTVNGSSGQGINFECRSGRVVDNYVFGPTSNGISVHNESDSNGAVTVTGNTVRNPGGHGIAVYPGIRGTTAFYQYAMVRGNFVLGVTGASYAYQFGNTAVPATLDRNVTFTNNTAVSCTGAYIFLIRNVQGLEYSGNLYDTSTGLISVTDAGNAPSYQSQTITADTLLTNPQITVLNVSPETGTTDNLATVNGGRRGQTLTLKTASATHTVTIVQTGNLRLSTAAGTTYSLTGTGTISFISNGTNWVESNRSA